MAEEIKRKVGRPSKVEIYKRELEKISELDPNGVLRPESLVEVARDPAHPFHNRFTWTDSEAAAKFRIIEARLLITQLRVVLSPLKITVRALTSLDVDRTSGGGYRWMDDVMADSRLRANLLATALRELRSMESKYAHLQELANVWDSLDEVERQTQIQDRVRV